MPASNADVPIHCMPAVKHQVSVHYTGDDEAVVWALLKASNTAGAEGMRTEITVIARETARTTWRFCSATGVPHDPIVRSVNGPCKITAPQGCYWQFVELQSTRPPQPRTYYLPNNITSIISNLESRGSAKVYYFKSAPSPPTNEVLVTIPAMKWFMSLEGVHASADRSDTVKHQRHYVPGPCTLSVPATKEVGESFALPWH